MKKTVIVIAMLTLAAGISYAGNSFEKSMKEGKEMLKNQKSIDDLQNTSTYFAEVAEANHDEWLPLYYSALSKLIVSFRMPDSIQKTQVIDNAQEQITKALLLSPNESELVTLQGFLYQARILINPAKYGQVYWQKASAEFTRAIELDSNNPRPHYLTALNILHTPVEYGGGKEASCGTMQKAEQLFERFEPASPFHPNWGAEDCSYYAKSCTEN